MKTVVIVLLMSACTFGFSDTISSLGYMGDLKPKIGVLNCTSTRKTEKIGQNGADRRITEFYTINLPKPCATCIVVHVVKSFGAYETTVGGIKGNRPRMASSESIRTSVQKDSAIYCHSVTQGTNTQQVSLKPLVETQDYEYTNVYTGKGVGRPKRIGYSHKGFIVIATWPDSSQQIFSNISEVRDKFKAQGADFLDSYMKDLVKCSGTE